VVVLVAVISLALGTTLGYSMSSGKSSVTTETQTVTDSASIVVIRSTTVTSVSSLHDPSLVAINGTIETGFYMPVEVSFRLCYYGNLTGILGSTYCGNANYSSPVTNISTWNVTSNFAGPTVQVFNGTYSLEVPNNSTYDVYLVIRDPSQANLTSNYEKVDVVRLPVYSASPNISNYKIGCGYEGAGNSFYWCVAT
jgi:hypothetical protein